MTTTTIKHQEDIRVIKTPNQQMWETPIERGLVFEVYKQGNTISPDKRHTVAIVQVKGDLFQAIDIETWNRFTDIAYGREDSVGSVMQCSEENYISFKVLDSIEVVIK